MSCQTIKSHLITHNGSASNIDPGKGEPSKMPHNKDGLWCTNYQKPRHNKETCRQLHGKPRFYEKNGGNRIQQLYEQRGGQVNYTQSKDTSIHGSSMSDNIEIEGLNKKKTEKL